MQCMYVCYSFVPMQTLLASYPGHSVNERPGYEAKTLLTVTSSVEEGLGTTLIYILYMYKASHLTAFCA